MAKKYVLVSFVGRGRLRKRILEVLKEARTPTQVSRLIKTPRSTTSRAILELERKALVACLTPEERMGRLYKITALGGKTLRLMRSSNA